jgi:hypothetical protein
VPYFRRVSSAGCAGHDAARTDGVFSALASRCPIYKSGPCWLWLFFGLFCFLLTRAYGQPPLMQSRKTEQLQVISVPLSPHCQLYNSAHILMVTVALVSIYIPNRVTQGVLLHPIRNNIIASVQQLADAAKGLALPVDALQVRVASLAAMHEPLKRTRDRWSRCCAQ